MTDERDVDGNLLPDAQFELEGRFVRSTSIDELPQLIKCIERGYGLDRPSSFVSPISAVIQQEQARRHEVRPGITAGHK